jgi:hypothetical protein
MSVVSVQEPRFGILCVYPLNCYAWGCHLLCVGDGFMLTIAPSVKPFEVGNLSITNGIYKLYHHGSRLIH